jgi:hypothetical protein
MSVESPNRVVVADVHMPFWSMVVFMVKWAFAAIPAMIILALAGVLIAAVLGGFSGGAGQAWHKSSAVDLEPEPYTVQSTLNTPVVSMTNVPKFAERCKGSPELAKCVALEKRLAEETPEQRRARQAELEAGRKAALAQVR